MLQLFVENWNHQYRYPQLKIGSVDQLFAEFEKRYGKQLPVHTGEISPYWEDGAYSSAAEEMQNRKLVLQTLTFEKAAARKGILKQLAPELYLLHKNIVLFHEHTWGAWCSISDPETYFSTEQWRIKKKFVDSAQYYYDQLVKKTGIHPVQDNYQATRPSGITDFTVDPGRGAISEVQVSGKKINAAQQGFFLFEPVYILGVNPSVTYRLTDLQVKQLENTARRKVVEASGNLPSLPGTKIIYTLDKVTGRLTVVYKLNKLRELNKESLHIALSLPLNNPVIEFGTEQYVQRFPDNQLPGSNKEFICVEKEIVLTDNHYKACFRSPLFSLYETDGPVDETRVNGAKLWKKESPSTARLFLYALNNYWHTNYKAYQEGPLNIELDLYLSKNK